VINHKNLINVHTQILTIVTHQTVIGNIPHLTGKDCGSLIALMGMNSD